MSLVSVEVGKLGSYSNLLESGREPIIYWSFEPDSVLNPLAHCFSAKQLVLTTHFRSSLVGALYLETQAVVGSLLHPHVAQWQS